MPTGQRQIMAKIKGDAVRIQTSILNAAEKKVLVWLAQRQPHWVTSDLLTLTGTLGAVVIATGYILSARNINFLWLSSLGFLINWYGDSLDGTLARVRNTQRPIYGYYIDHTMDAICEVIIAIGIGLSGLVSLSLALMVIIGYLLLTINVSINAHLKKEFLLTYFGLGPTEFRLIMILVNTAFIIFPSMASFQGLIVIGDTWVAYKAMDVVAAVILVILLIIYTVTVVKDARDYAKRDPLPKRE